MAENIESTNDESTNNESTNDEIGEISEENADDQKVQAEKRSVLFVVYPVLLVLVAGVAVLGTMLFYGRESSTQQEITQTQFKGDVFGYKVNPDSRRIFIPPITNPELVSVQPKNDYTRLAMVRLQLIVNSKVMQRWDGLLPQVQDILRGNIREQINLVLGEKTTAQLQSYDKNKRDQYARELQNYINMYVFNQFSGSENGKKIKKGQPKKSFKTHFPKDPIEKVIFYEMLVVTN